MTAMRARRRWWLSEGLDDGSAEVHDPADYAPVIDPWHAVRQWKMRIDPSHLRFARQEQANRQSLPIRNSASHSLED